MPRQLQIGSQRHSTPFTGFGSPTSNTVYTPNQFFDVCLRHGSRGAIRVVAFLIRQTLGWSDHDGKPLRERHAISYADFELAGVGKDTIRGALAEAVEGRFIRCIRAPQASSAGRTSVVGLYELNWDLAAEYLKDPTRFQGFFASEGNRTFIPNAFFDQVVPHETLAVVKVVGAVIRFSIGFQTQWGHRRQQVALSYQDLQNYTRIGSRDTLSAAIHSALHSNYLTRVSEGYFDPNGGRLSAKACYALKWLNDTVDAGSTRKSVPAESESIHHSEIRTGTARKNEPEKHPENRTDIQRTLRKNIPKQQSDAAASPFERLKAEGFDAAATKAIASRYPAERIHRQLDWIDERKVSSNRLGMLRAAIAQDWEAPATADLRRRKFEDAEPPACRGESLQDALSHARSRLLRRSSTFTNNPS
jgi:hypothetical protein